MKEIIGIEERTWNIWCVFFENLRSWKEINLINWDGDAITEFSVWFLIENYKFYGYFNIDMSLFNQPKQQKE